MKDINEGPLGRLIGHIARTQSIRVDQLMDNYELYQGQAIILMILSESEYMTHSEIAAKLHVSPAAASKTIKRLEQKGFVKRTSDPTDERISRVYLQEEGLAVITQIKNSFREVEQIMFEGFSPDEKEILRGMLIRIRSNLKATFSENCR